MTKDDVIAETARRLGDSSSSFLTILGTVFDRVLDELAGADCLRALSKVATFTFTLNTRDYSTRTITGLSAPQFPRDIKRILVPRWGPDEGRIHRVSEEQYHEFRLRSTKSDGTNQASRPRVWTLQPNEQQISFDPAPDADSVITNAGEVYYLAHATSLSGATEISEVRQSHIPALIGGMLKHGLVFQDETLVDRPLAVQEWELFKQRMRADAHRERGRAVRMARRWA